MNRYKKNARLIFRRLKRRHPDARIELVYGNPVELLVATVLSAQCTDRRVNQITERLFKKYHQPEGYLSVRQAELEADIRSLGFFRQKAKAIRGAMSILLRDYGGQVPRDMESLTRLPGVGRKTANVILGNAFGVAGIAVDTHVIRLSNRIGLTNQTDPEKIEQALQRLFPPRDWTLLSHLLIFHGRRVCKARKPLCPNCRINDLCRYYGETK
ncbi:MAG: endonuclease III [Verrucomicrobia bacterium]|nr:endonuclease III [Verrucomicrobiota bacterium]MCG2678806.1 endonuclease III [Kiritimatiellia bacterium]MBU4247004.1 endonuclease III [Verrucomicrobiota bacterium]MBU4291877.1 endonuclease III [Verrucomicrobiota bacterium]MBU4430473.1 endonuclease III [Verrucomicrobiota bacterium]